MFLIVKNIACEGPGIIQKYLDEKKIPYNIVDAWESLPDTLNDITSLLVLGGPMNVYETEKYPFLKKEDPSTWSMFRCAATCKSVGSRCSEESYQRSRL